MIKKHQPNKYNWPKIQTSHTQTHTCIQTQIIHANSNTHKHKHMEKYARTHRHSAHTDKQTHTEKQTHSHRQAQNMETCLHIHRQTQCTGTDTVKHTYMDKHTQHRQAHTTQTRAQKLEKDKSDKHTQQ